MTTCILSLRPSEAKSKVFLRRKGLPVRWATVLGPNGGSITLRGGSCVGGHCRGCRAAVGPAASRGHLPCGENPQVVCGHSGTAPSSCLLVSPRLTLLCFCRWAMRMVRVAPSCHLQEHLKEEGRENEVLLVTGSLLLHLKGKSGLRLARPRLSGPCRALRLRS